MIAPALLDELRDRVPVSTVVRRRVSLRKAGREWRGLSPFNKERSPSFFVNDKKRFWHDFSSGKHGDIFDFIQETEGVGFHQAVEQIAAMAGATVSIPRSSPGHWRGPGPGTPGRPPIATGGTLARAKSEGPIRDDAASRALAIWIASTDIGGTPSAAYLASRKLVLPEGMSGRVLRHHPRCPWKTDADELIRVPALIALFRDISTDEPRAISRRPLTADGRKLGKPRYLGPMAGCAAKLTANEDVAEGLHIGEGIETMLAAMTLGFAPAWTTGGTGNLQTFPVLAGIEALTIIVDHDPNGAGQKAALECSRRWTAAGREVWRVVPDEVGDMNDIIIEGE